MSSASSKFLWRFLMGGVVMGAAWWFHSRQLVPLRQREIESVRAVAGVQQRLDDAKLKIDEIAKEDQEASDARRLLDSLQGDVPNESVVVWFPVRLRTHLRKAGIEDSGIRVNTVMPEPGVPGYERSNWHLNLPKQGGMRSISEVLLAVAEIERQEPFVRVLDVSFGSDSEEPHRPAGSLNVTVLAPK